MFTPNDNTQEHQQRRENFRQQARYIEEAFAHLATQQKSLTSTEADKDSVGIAFVGQTGAGKSTLINFLLGRRLILWDSDKHGEREDRIDNYLYLDDSEDPMLAAGMAEKAESCTQYINQFPIPDVPVGEMRDKTCVIYDTPGFGDTDTNRQFANGLLLEEMIKQHGGLRVAIVLSSDSFRGLGASKGESFKKLAKYLGAFLNLDKIDRDITFLINVQEGKKFTLDKAQKELNTLHEALNAEYARIPEDSKKKDTLSGIVFCEFLQQYITNNLVIITHPLKDDRAAILSQLAEVAPLGVEGLNFQTGERQTFKDDLTDYFIVPSLNELRRLSVLEAAVTGNMAYQEKLATYLALLSSDKFADTLAKDFTLEKEQLNKYRKQDEQLTEKLNKAEQALEALEPDAEISLVDISAKDNFLFNYGTGSLLNVLINYTPLRPVVYGTAWLTDFVSTSTSSMLRNSLYRPYSVVITKHFKHIVRTQTRTNEYPKEVRSNDSFMLVDSSPKISENHQECTVIFECHHDNKRRNTVVSIMVKKEHHPDFAEEILNLRTQIDNAKANLEEVGKQLELTHAMTKLLGLLIEMQESNATQIAMENIVKDSIAVVDPSGDTASRVNELLTELREYKDELHTIQKVLQYISVPIIQDEFKKAYAHLLNSRPEFIVEDALTTSSSKAPVLASPSASLTPSPSSQQTASIEKAPQQQDPKRVAQSSSSSPHSSHEKGSLSTSPVVTPPPPPSSTITSKSDRTTQDTLKGSETERHSTPLFIAPEDITLGCKIGEGALGVVYEGSYVFQKVAIKQYLGTQMPEKEARAMRAELDIMHQLQHECLVRLFGFVCDEKNPAMIVMEYGANGSLYNFLHSERDITWGLRLRIADELARGLAYLHHKKVIHRDIKSLNVVLDKDFHAKWCDFGLAVLKLHTSTTTKPAENSNPVGTMRWMAPELFSRKTSKPSTASDIWALGMVFFELASRQIPYAGILDNDEVKAKIKAITGEEVPEECQTNAPQFGALMQRCWAERTHRPSAAEVVETLNDINRTFTAEQPSMSR